MENLEEQKKQETLNEENVEEVKNPSYSMAIICLVMGIWSLLLYLFLSNAIWGVLLGFAAFCVGAVSISQKESGKGMVIAGLVCCSITWGLTLLRIVTNIVEAIMV